MRGERPFLKNRDKNRPDTQKTRIKKTRRTMGQDPKRTIQHLRLARDQERDIRGKGLKRGRRIGKVGEERRLGSKTADEKKADWKKGEENPNRPHNKREE